MSLNFKIINHATKQERVVSRQTWDYMKSDGRSRYWAVVPDEQEPKPLKKVKQEIKIEAINIINEPKDEDGTN
jgi:hypothetical protein